MNNNNNNRLDRKYDKLALININYYNYENCFFSKDLKEYL
jgi:hypothetical protein